MNTWCLGREELEWRRGGKKLDEPGCLSNFFPSSRRLRPRQIQRKANPESVELWEQPGVCSDDLLRAVSVL